MCSILHFSAPLLAQHFQGFKTSCEHLRLCDDCSNYPAPQTPYNTLSCDLYSTRFYNKVLQYVLPLMEISLMGSVYCTIALALERFIAVCYPFTHRRNVNLKLNVFLWYHIFIYNVFINFQTNILHKDFCSSSGSVCHPLQHTIFLSYWGCGPKLDSLVQWKLPPNTQ